MTYAWTGLSRFQFQAELLIQHGTFDAGPEIGLDTRK